MIKISNEVFNRMTEYEKELIRLSDTVDDLRCHIYEMIEKAKVDCVINMDFELPIDSWQAKIIDNNIIKITANDVPPKYKHADSQFKKRWGSNVANAIRRLGVNIKYEKVAVIIKFYMNNKEWDIDNRDYKPIIDGIRYTGIINGDTFDKVNVITTGSYLTNVKAYTEIFILDFKQIEKLLQYLKS